MIETISRYNSETAPRTRRAERTNQVRFGLFTNPRSLPVLVGLAALLLAGCAVPVLFTRAYLIICKFSPEQQAAAEKEVQRYTEAVQKKERPPAKHRYIAVRTLDPNEKQRAAYVKKREAEKKWDEGEHFLLSPDWVEPDSLHCVMVFDTESKQFVGSGCYVVGQLPAEGAVEKFETYNAEYVSSGTASF